MPCVFGHNRPNIFAPHARWNQVGGQPGLGSAGRSPRGSKIRCDECLDAVIAERLADLALSFLLYLERRVAIIAAFDPGIEFFGLQI